ERLCRTDLQRLQLGWIPDLVSAGAGDHRWARRFLWRQEHRPFGCDLERRAGLGVRSCTYLGWAGDWSGKVSTGPTAADGLPLQAGVRGQDCGGFRGAQVTASTHLPDNSAPPPTADLHLLE